MASFEKGRYLFRVTNQGFSEAANDKKTPYFFLQGEPQSRLTEEGHYEPCDQWARTIKLYITEKTTDTVLDQLAELGFVGKWSQLDPSNPKAHSFVGSEIVAVCSHEAGNDGKFYDKFELPRKASPAELVKSDPNIGRKLDAMFGKQAAARAPKPPATPQQPLQEQAAALVGQEDVPF